MAGRVAGEAPQDDSRPPAVPVPRRGGRRRARPAPSGAPDAAEAPAETLLTEISATVREVADQSRRYHDRAEQREGVIDLLRSELEVLRRGERRGLLRPVLADMCRLRSDLLSQAAALPADFDAAKAAGPAALLRGDHRADAGEQRRRHLRPDGGDGSTPGCTAGSAPRRRTTRRSPGHVSEVRRDGYLDIEANSPIAPAEVTVFAAAKPARQRKETVSEPQHGIYGIDLGTTYSVVSYIDETGRPAVTRNSDSQDTTPSVVYFESADNIVVGRVAKETAGVFPDQVVSLIKREMGDREWRREFFGKEYTPPSASPR